MALRYGLLVEAYLHGTYPFPSSMCLLSGQFLTPLVHGVVITIGIGPQHREEILTQVFITDELRTLSDALKKIPKNKRDAFLKYKLSHFPFPPNGVTLPSEPGYVPILHAIIGKGHN